MKVINGPKEWSWRFDCSGCGTVCEAALGDIEWAMFGAAHYAGDSGDKRYYATCPVCGSDNFLPEEKLTPLVERTAKKWGGEQ